MRRIFLALASLVLSLGVATAQPAVPNVPDSARSIAYNVTSATTNFDVPFALYGDCTDLIVKVAGVVQTSGFTCISKSGTPFGNVAQPVTDAQVQFTSAVSNSLVEIAGNRHPRFSMGTAPGVTRQEFNRTLGTILSRQRESYDRLVPLGAVMSAGFGFPSSSIGSSGNYYTDLGTGNVYGPKSNVWPGLPVYIPSVISTGVPMAAFVTGSPGIACDGTTDANAGGALQAVINLAASSHRRLYWPVGADCHLKTPISVPSDADWEGLASTISFDASIGVTGALNVAMSMDGTSNFRFNGMTFTGPGSTAINTNARIVGQNNSNGLITNSTFQFFGSQQNFTGTLTSGSNVVTAVSSVAGLKIGMQVNDPTHSSLGTITAIGTNTITMSAPSPINSSAAAMWGNFYAQGIELFVPTNVKVQFSTFQNNSGDGLTFSNSVQGSRILYNKFASNYDSAIVLCTINGSDNQAVGNTISAPASLTNPAIISERCQNSVISFNTINSGAGSNAIRIARYANTADFNQDIKIIGNTISGGGNISVESSSTVQGTASVPKGGLFEVTGNNIISPSGAGISLTDSAYGSVTNNTISGAGGEGIIENAATSGVSTGNNTITGNFVNVATYCFRQLVISGTLLSSEYIGNIPVSCSVASLFLDASAHYFDKGNISGAAGSVPANALTGTTLPPGVTTSSLTIFGSSPSLNTPILQGGFATLNGTTSGATFLSWPAIGTGGTMSLQSGNDTLVARNTTDTLTNKSLTSPALTGTPTTPTAAVDTNTTQVASTAFVLAQAALTTPPVDGTAAAGTSTRYARADHVHPTDTSRAAVNSPTLTGTPAAPTAAVDTNTTQIATTAFVLAQASSTTPANNGTAAVGTSTRYARADHVHATDTSRAAAATTITPSGSITGGGDLSANRTLAYSGDGAWTTYTPTVTSTGTLPTTADATASKWKQIATKTYMIRIKWNVTTLGPGTAGFVSFTLPNSSTATDTFSCSSYDGSTGQSVAGAAANSTTATMNISGSLAAHTYYIACFYEAS